MPRVVIKAAEEAEKLITLLTSSLAKNGVHEPDPTMRHTFPGRVRFLKQGYLRRQMWRAHTAAIMKNFEQIKVNREAIRQKLKLQRDAAESL